jgi:hypothetical protein
MRTFFFRLALCAGLVFPSLGVATGQDDPSCPLLVEQEAYEDNLEGIPRPSHSQNAPVSRMRQILATLGLVCVLGGGGYVACRTVMNNHDLRMATIGAAIVVSGGWALSVGQKFIGPQADYLGRWTDRTGMAVNHNILQWYFGKISRLRAMGDPWSPNLNVDIKGRQDENQQLTAGKIGSLSTHLDWLGLRIPQLLDEGQIELAASQLVTTVIQMAYHDQEIIVRTAEPHIDAMTRDLVLLAAESYLFEKLAHYFGRDPGLLPRFNGAIQEAIEKKFAKRPLPFIAYREGIEIVLNGWMADAVREMCGQEFCVRLPR